MEKCDPPYYQEKYNRMGKSGIRRERKATQDSSQKQNSDASVETLLRRFGLPTCGEVYQAIQSDSVMSDERKLELIQDHKVGLKNLCAVVARERRTRGDQATDALLEVARTTVHRLRVSAVSYGENMFALLGTDMTEATIQKECLERVRGEPDCVTLWQLEEELRLRLGQPVGWSRKLLDWARGGMKVVQEGSTYVLKTIKNVMIRVFHSAWDLICFLMPYMCTLWDGFSPVLARRRGRS